MQGVKIREDIYWVGAIDYTIRNFHGYETGRGTTYNAYLILDEKVTLIDATKDTFTDEIMGRIKSIIDPSKIEVVIISHLESDHTGSMKRILQYCPNANIYVSAPSGIKNVIKFCGEGNYIGVKQGDSINIGKRTLDFIPVPLLHWPDSMITYCKEEKILFSNDAFGQHLSSVERFDDEVDMSELYFETKKYYANILMLYGRQTLSALKAIENLDIEMILTGHGVSWRKYIKEVLAWYRIWGDFKYKDNEAVVVYDSMWKSTEVMAKTIAEALWSKGIHTKICDLKVVHYSDVVTYLLEAKYLFVGSPTLNNQMMPNVAAFLCYLKGLVPKKHNRSALAFGSYGWGGQSISLVEKELAEADFNICHEMIRQNNQPTSEDLDKLREAIDTIIN